MVHWTAEEKATINAVWKKIDLEHDGGDALGRLLLVYPWTQRYFSSFGNLSNAAAIAGNAKVQAHGKRVLGALDNAAHHLDTIKATLRDLSDSHAHRLYVDPENFRVCIYYYYFYYYILYNYGHSQIRHVLVVMNSYSLPLAHLKWITFKMNRGFHYVSNLHLRNFL
ncbi:hemoglobin subunit beta-2-like [Pelobates fuscus]|uniref:hemoglobin subunit beta-2-like n=1 Tax=Pelobates fuscus TaxID=191477 RepID=UPI002FE48173